VDPLRPIRSFDRFQQRHPVWAVPMAVIRKFGNDQAGSLAALLAYYSFFSIFPLLLVFSTILGFVLQENSKFYEDISTSVLGHFPGLQLQTHPLTGSVTALVLGLLTSLWAGLGVTVAAQNAFARIWAVPFKDRPDFLRSRVRGLLLLMVLGVLFVASAVLTALVTVTLSGTLLKIGGYAITLTVNFGLYVAAFRFLTPSTIPTRSLWLGAGVAAVFLEILQLVGGIYVKHVRDRDRAARVAAHHRPADDVRGRDQHCRRAPAVAAQPARAARVTRRPRDADGARQDGGAPRARVGRGPVRGLLEEAVGGFAPGHLERPRAQAALRRAALADRAVGGVGDPEVALEHAPGESH
jgi:membrane protein